MSFFASVLIVDDEEDFCHLLKKNLEATGEFKVFFAHNGQDGMTLAHIEQPDIILLDVMMPDISGAEVANILKKDEKVSDIPIIFLTAIIKKDEIGVEPMRKIGAHRYIAKPIKTQTLVECIKETINAKK
ncbi:MAG: response regulator [Candidatus Omnitrophica bacterium]|nr:response regulator [Candidatus Omnitrophota bacterium]